MYMELKVKSQTSLMNILQSKGVQKSCFKNGMILNVGKTTIVSFTRKNVSIN
jgi:hypothetical protein